LQRKILVERLLQFSEMSFATCESLDGRDFASLDLNGEIETGARGAAIHADRAGAAYPVLASYMSSGRTDLAAQEIGQQVLLSA
jgi:hypothetical protein